jgi:hypothetical protein
MYMLPLSANLPPLSSSLNLHVLLIIKTLGSHGHFLSRVFEMRIEISNQRHGSMGIFVAIDHLTWPWANFFYND